MVYLLNHNDLSFPDPGFAEEDGLLAVGGDLTPERLLVAYNNAIFPWFTENGVIYWYSPHERCVIFPDQLIISKSMKKIMQRNVFSITMNTSFEQVIENCKTVERKDQDSTWISTMMQEAYIKFHTLGHAHSVEVWKGTQLVGGLYGVIINNVFCGESMFSKVSNASKAALIWLSTKKEFELIDCQVANPHLLSLGATMISRKEYLSIVHKSR